MKKLSKTSLALALAATMVAAGCSGNSDPKPSASPTGSVNAPTNAPANDENEFAETITITTNASTWDIPTNDGNPTQRYLEERYNVKFVNMRATDENFKVKVASGEIPDIFSHNITEADMANWARQGVIASISIDEIKQYMPNYVAHIESINPNPWDVGIIDGKNYGVPRNWLNGAYGFIPTFNGEWLKAIGYSEPPQTIEELEDVLTKFRNDDPDGNGVKDTYGMSGRSKDVRIQLFNSIFAAHGVNPYYFKLASDGTVTWGGITDESKETLKLLRKWYEGGLIDPEFMTDDGALVDQKFLSQKLGYFDHKMYHHNFGGETAAKESGITQVYGKGLTGPAGENLVMSNGSNQAPLLFGKQVENDEAKRIRILKMLEDFVTNEEPYLRTVFGVEGESYDLVDGFVVMKEEFTATPDKAREMGIGGYYNPLIERDPEMWKFHFTKERLEFRDRLNAGLNLVKDVLGPTSLEAKAKYLANLNTQQDEFYVKAIIGKDDIDQSFETFKAQWLKSGGQELIDEATKVYKDRQAAQ